MQKANQCEECGSELRGRSDKRFCSDYCRNSFHNRRNRSKNKFRYQIHQRLHKNRKILEELLGGRGRIVVRRENLLLQGFDHRYITQVSSHKGSGRYFFVYEYGFRHLKEGRVLLVHKTG